MFDSLSWGLTSSVRRSLALIILEHRHMQRAEPITTDFPDIASADALMDKTEILHVKVYNLLIIYLWKLHLSGWTGKDSGGRGSLWLVCCLLRPATSPTS